MTDQEYFEVLDRVVKGAEYIESLPLNDSKLSAAMAKYDRLVESILEYKARGETVKNG